MDADASGLARPVLEGPDIARVLTRIAHEIVERAKGADDVVLLGIPTRGVFLAQRVAAKLEEITGRAMPVGSLTVVTRWPSAVTSARRKADDSNRSSPSASVMCPPSVRYPLTMSVGTSPT